MNLIHQGAVRWALAGAIVFTAVAGCASMPDSLQLTGAQEVPPVSTSATGSGYIKVVEDGSVSGQIKTTGLAGTAAHIHAGAKGMNGPAIIPLTQASEGVWSVPAGAKLSAEQVRTYQEGGLYVNVHSDAHKGGEVRAQLTP